MELTDNLNIIRFRDLITPESIKVHYPAEDEVSGLVAKSRKAVQNILNGSDARKMLITGPCSLHDTEASLDYARRLCELQRKSRIRDKLLIIMRAYFEKPRTTIGWKGMLYDPHLDGSYDIEEGLKKSREIMLQINKIGLPVATEFLDPIVPQYLADLVSWAAIGARTTESQIHRQMASGLSMPIGFKNSTDGNLSVAIDAINAASSKHSFLGIDRNGQVIIAETRGNRFGHLVMRGGTNEPNYGSEYVAFAEVRLRKAGVFTGIIIDCSHANSFKKPNLQRDAMLDIVTQINAGNKLISGIMLESFITEGKQKIVSTDKLEYGKSVTDGCIGWDETAEMVAEFAGF